MAEKIREILFRGKSVDCGSWEEGYLLYGENSGKQEARIGRHYDKDRNNPASVEAWALVVDPDTVGQFTGLLDKNGNKIFEDDILKDKFNHIWLVTYERGAFCITNGRRSGTLFDPYAEDEIIGNKWDNPELLNL